MGRIKWYARDANAALTGMAKLSLEERGAYNTVIDLIYIHDGAVDDDAEYLCGWLRCRPQVWRRIRERLLSLGKLYLHAGKLRNERCDLEVEKVQNRLVSCIKGGLASAASRGFEIKKNKHLALSEVQRQFELLTITKKERKKEPYLATDAALARSPVGEHRAAPPPPATPTVAAKRPSDVTRAELDEILRRKRLATETQHAPKH